MRACKFLSGSCPQRRRCVLFQAVGNHKIKHQIKSGISVDCCTILAQLCMIAYHSQISHVSQKDSIMRTQHDMFQWQRTSFEAVTYNIAYLRVFVRVTAYFKSNDRLWHFTGEVSYPVSPKHQYFDESIDQDISQLHCEQEMQLQRPRRKLFRVKWERERIRDDRQLGLYN